MNTISTQDFENKLGKVDFSYDYLEDYCQWKDAHDFFWEVKKLADSNPDFKELFEKRNIFSN